MKTMKTKMIVGVMGGLALLPVVVGCLFFGVPVQGQGLQKETKVTETGKTNGIEVSSMFRSVASNMTITLLVSTNGPDLFHNEFSDELVTNWITTSIETPAIALGHEFDAVMRYGVLHQNGQVQSNYFATATWKGKKIRVLLESNYLALELNRTISAAPVEFFIINPAAAYTNGL